MVFLILRFLGVVARAPKNEGLISKLVWYRISVWGDGLVQKWMAVMSVEQRECAWGPELCT